MSIKYETADGKAIWERGSLSAPPPFISLKAGQTADQAVQDAMNLNYRFFETVRLPKYVAKSRAGVGTSKLTAAGAEASAPASGV
jgi:hypothetical protein